MRSLYVLVIVLCVRPVFAQEISLQSVDAGDFKRLVGDFSAASTHTSVAGASPLGRIFGFEVGVVAGQTKTPELNALVRESDPGASAGQLPHGEILGAVSVPAGVTLEAGFIPKVGGEDFKFSALNLAVKWTFSDLVEELPLRLAVKGSWSSTRLEFASSVASVPTQFKYTNTVTGLQLLASKDLGVLEPYFGIGTLRGDGRLQVSGSGAVFSDPAFAAASEAKAATGAVMWMIGTEVKLLIWKLGAEYARQFNTNSFAGKVSVCF